MATEAAELPITDEDEWWKDLGYRRGWKVVYYNDGDNTLMSAFVGHLRYRKNYPTTPLKDHGPLVVCDSEWAARSTARICGEEGLRGVHLCWYKPSEKLWVWSRVKTTPLDNLPDGSVLADCVVLGRRV